MDAANVGLGSCFRYAFIWIIEMNRMEHCELPVHISRAAGDGASPQKKLDGFRSVEEVKIGVNNYA